MFYRSPRGVTAAVLFLFLCFFNSIVLAEILSFEQLLAAALTNSFDIKIAREEIQVGRAYVGETQAAYYPQLSVRFGNEYVHAFDEQSEVVSVGDAIIANNESGYKHSLIAGLSYTLFDFGIRKLTVENARRQLQISSFQEKQSFRDTQKEILRHYSNGLKLQKQIRVFRSIVDRQQRIFRLSRQLRLAGTVGHEQVGNAALDLAETLSQLDSLNIQFQDVLEGFSFYTQKTYPHNEVVLAGIGLPDKAEDMVNLDALPEVQQYQLQIDSKKSELSIAKRSRLPKLTLYGAYRMFGSGGDSFTRSLSNLTSRDASLTLYFELPLFTGFENRSKQARLNHEIASLHYQKQKKKAELKQELSRLLNSHATYSAAQQNRQEQLRQISDAQDAAERLAEQQLTDQIRFQNRMIELQRQQLGVDLLQVDHVAAALALNLMQKAEP